MAVFPTRFLEESLVQANIDESAFPKRVVMQVQLPKSVVRYDRTSDQLTRAMGPAMALRSAYCRVNFGADLAGLVRELAL